LDGCPGAAGVNGRRRSRRTAVERIDSCNHHRSAAGKYTVDLEKPGYKFFQKEVEVKPGKTLKVDAPLKKK